MRVLIIVALLLLQLPLTVDAKPVTGFAARYRPGLMALVADRRNIPRTNCMIASSLYAIKTVVAVTGPTKKTYVCTVVDVCNPVSKEGGSDCVINQRKRIFIELSHEITDAICGKGATKRRPQDCPVSTRVS